MGNNNTHSAIWGGKKKRLTGEPRKTMRWRRSMLVVSSSSRRGFLAAGRAADGPGSSHAEESVRRAADADARTVALGAAFQQHGLGARKRDDGDEEDEQGEAGRAAMAAAASISWLAAASAAAAC